MLDTDIEIIEDDEEVYPQELELSGLLLKEELLDIINLCKSKIVKESRCLPLKVKYNDTSKFVGNLELTFNNLVKLTFISKDYNLKLIDNVGNREVFLFNRDSPFNGQSLFKVINLV